MLRKWKSIDIFQFASHIAFELLYVKRTTLHDTTKSRPLYVHTKKFQFLKILLNATCDLARSLAATHSLRNLGPPTVSEYVEHSHARRARTNSQYRTDSFRHPEFQKVVARGGSAQRQTTLACTSPTWASPSW